MKINIGIKKKYKKNGIMFCKVVKSVYICISKQVIRNLSVLADEFWCVGATLNNEVAGRLIEKFQQKFAKLKNIPTFVIEKR